MSNEIPQLDKRTYEDLLESMMKLIPVYTKEWTNFNQSDPGITILQLLCWIIKSLNYRLNHIPLITYINILCLIAGATRDEITSELNRLEAENLDQDYINLLKLLQEIEAGAKIDLPALQAKVLTFFNSPYLAITSDDFTVLALEANRIIPSDKIKFQRAIVELNYGLIYVIVVSAIPNQYIFPMTAQLEEELTVNFSRQIMVGLKAAVDQLYTDSIPYIEQYLAPRKLLGSVIKVAQAVFTTVNIQLSVVIGLDVPLAQIVSSICESIKNYLDPIIGGPKGQGWEYNHAPTSAELSKLLYQLTGVAQVKSLHINFIPTIQLGVFATLGENTEIENFPQEFTNSVFKGLAQLRVLDIVVYKDVA